MSLWTNVKALFSSEQKMNPAWNSLVTFDDLPKPMTMPKNYGAYAKEGYRGCDTVYKVISYISRNGAAIPPKLYTDTTKQKEITSHPLLDTLNNPNTEQSGVAYREAILGFKLLSGNAYQYVIRAKNGPPDEIWPVRPDYMTIMASKSRGIVGYQYKFAESMYPASEVGHTKYWHPDNDEGYGLSPLEVAAIMVDQQTAAKKWNLSLLQNNARPPGAWSTPAMLAKNDRDNLERKLNEKFAGFKNAGKFPVLDGGLKWEAMGLPPAQMDYLDMLKFNAGAIANIYNIAPQLIGDTSASTYNNMDQAKEASYTEAIFPELDDLYALWNNWLIPMYPDLKAMGAYLYYDKESVEVIQKVIQAQKDAMVTRATKIYMSGGCDLAQYQDMCGIKPDKNAKGIYRVGQVLVPSDKLQEYAEQSLQKPAGPPMLVPEPNLNMPTPGQAPLQGQDTQEQPAKKPGQQDQQEPTKKPAKKPVEQEAEPTKKPDKTPKKSKDMQDDEEEGHTGVMVAFFLDKKDAKELAIPDGEPVDDLHVTLAYLGDKGDYSASELTKLKKTVADFAASAEQVSGRVSGVGRFTSVEDGELTPVYASVDIPGLSGWREGLTEALTDAGFSPDETHGFTPHITLAYIDADESMPVENVSELELSFNEVWLAIGGERFAFALETSKKAIEHESRVLVATSTKADDYVRRLSRAPTIQKKTVPQGNDGVSVKRKQREAYRAFMERMN